MSTINYTLRLDEVDKQNAEQVFKGLGMSFATGINVYIKTVGRQKKIPFVLSLNDKDILAKKIAWNEFKNIVENSSHENHLFLDESFLHSKSGRELIDFSDEE